MSSASTQGDLEAVAGSVHAENALSAEMSLDIRNGDASARRVSLQTAKPGHLTEHFKAADETLHYVPPSIELPPRDLYRRPTDVWQPVRFLGLPASRHPADRPLPSSCMHVRAEFMDDVETDCTLEVAKESTAAPKSAVVRTAEPVPDAPSNVSSAGSAGAFAGGVAR